MRKAIIRPDGSSSSQKRRHGNQLCRRRRACPIALDGTSRKPQHNFRRQRLVAVAHHRGHAGHPRQFFGRTLRVAARHHDLCFRIHPVRPADKRPRRAIGLGRHAARVHDHHFGLRVLPRAVPGVKQLAGDGLAIRPCRPATKIFDVKARHLFQCRAVVAFASCNSLHCLNSRLRYTSG